ncbi:MAG TPA: MarC family protein [Caulobacteraceae bacterium]|nr:MarC family protein [Caulobacteraceae bacterium]
MSHGTDWLTALVMLFVTIGPIEGAVVFGSLTSHGLQTGRAALARRAVLIAGVMLFLFGVAGARLLGLLGISIPAFRIAGGLLLFLQAMTLTFASPGASSISRSEQSEAQRSGDMAVFPLAFPMIAGPASLSAIILLVDRAQSAWQLAGIAFALTLCLAATYLSMRACEAIVKLLGRTGSDVVGRVSGILLAALAVQFALDGLREALRL